MPLRYFLLKFGSFITSGYLSTLQKSFTWNTESKIVNEFFEKIRQSPHRQLAHFLLAVTLDFCPFIFRYSWWKFRGNMKKSCGKVFFRNFCVRSFSVWKCYHYIILLPFWSKYHEVSRSSHPPGGVLKNDRKVFLKILENSQGNTCARVTFLI